MSKKPLGPVVFDLEEPKKPKAAKTSVVETAAPVDPSNAPPIIDDDLPPQGEAMVAATRLVTRRISWIAKLFWGAIVALFLMILSTLAWDFAVDLLTRNVWLGRVAIGLGVIVGATLLLTALREFVGFASLSRLDGFRREADALHNLAEPKRANAFSHKIRRLYASRSDMKWAIENLRKQDDTIIDADGILSLTERELMTPLDKQARSEIEKAARQVAAATAIVPLALADVVVALTANIRMVRRIAEVYGGRTGTFGSWRLMRAVATHLIATGAVGVADDMISSVAGGGAVARLSRRFGEGIINGALTARVGVAAMDVCRPMPFVAVKKPGVTAIVKSALTGMFGKG